MKALRLLGLTLLCCFSCTRAPTHEEASESPAIAATLDSTTQPGQLRTVMGEPVRGRAGPNDRPFEVARRTPEPPAHYVRPFGRITIDIALRQGSPELSQYPCKSCHLGRGYVPGARRVADAHQNIQPVHPKETGATCVSCHAPENVELLAFQDGQRTSIDHAYRLCAQCHNAQVSAWAGGAHGKRLDGWQGRRVIMPCAACHDPHAPALRPRQPFRAPQLERKAK